MDKYIYINKNSIPKPMCIDIIELFENKNTNKIEGTTINGVLKNIKLTSDFVIPCNNAEWKNIFEYIVKEITDNLKQYIDNLNNNNFNNPYKFFDGVKLNINTFQIQKYTKNEGKYIYHNDFYISPDTNKPRVITYLWYLNDVIEGGETEINGNLQITPESGKLILFPSCWTYPHCGKMPISNDKYILTGWIYLD